MYSEELGESTLIGLGIL